MTKKLKIITIIFTLLIFGYISMNLSFSADAKNVPLDKKSTTSENLNTYKDQRQKSATDVIEKDTFKFLIAPLLASIFTAILTYLLTFHTISRKNEHEQIVRRYLEQGIDLLAANIDHASNTFNENYAHALGLLKEFRDTEKIGVPSRKESLEREFLLYKPESFSAIPFYKIKSLVGDDIFWLKAQDFFVFIDSAYNFFERDLKLAIKTYYIDRNKIKVSAAELADNYMNEVKKLMDESFSFGDILMELQNIALILETDTSLTFKKLEKLKKDCRIIETLDRLKKIEKTADLVTKDN